MATGFGLDVHAFGGEPPVILCGIVVDGDRGLAGTSNADVAAHAVADAILGAAVLGDLGTHFPSNEEFAGADSMDLLTRVVAMAAAESLAASHVDVTIISQSVRVAPHREAMRASLARVLGVSPEVVSIKATTTDGIGVIGRDEGVAAIALIELVEVS